MKSERLVHELDFEPKGLLDKPDGDPDWRNLDVTPNVEYSPKGWTDVVLDTTIGRTRQTDDVDTTEVTPRLGVRFHLFSRAMRFHPREQAPRRRVVVRDLVRVFANRQRIRTGLGYRHSFNWRFEALYIWTRSRNTIEDGFSTSEHIIDVRVKRLF